MILDTHVAFWLFEGNERIGPDTRRLAVDALNADSLYVSAVSFFEIATLFRRGRLTFGESANALRDTMSDEGLIELDVTADVAIAAGELDDLRGDPMDRLIVATAAAYGLTLVTVDRRILEWRGDLARHDART